MGVAEDIAPSFVKKPQLRQEDDGNRLIFECQLLSFPRPDIEWYRSDTLLMEDARTKFKIQAISDNEFTVVLDLDDVVETDAGLYKVKAKNKSGEVSASINLNFSPADEPKEKQIDGFAPTFVKKPAIRQEDDGKRLLFECRVNADPKPAIMWFHNSSQVKESSRHKLTIEKDSQSYFASLEIKNVTVEDAGKYKVNAKNELGESNATITLNFDSANDTNGFAPSFIEKPRIIPNDFGTLITMKCKCKAKPEPSVTWYRGQGVIKENQRIKIKSTLLHEDTYDLSLEIKDPGATDGGTYRCNVQNEFGESNANLNLNIESEPEPEGEGPTFIEKPRIVSENNGKLVVMECKVKADPKPDIIWTCNGKIVRESKNIKMFMEQRGDQYYIQLELIEPKLEDSGLYKCNIKNMLGELNANLTLNIEILPVIKDKPKIIKIIKKRTVVIECTVTSKFEPKCTWFKDSTAVKQNKRLVYLVEQTKEGEFAVKLEINEIKETDKGAYKLVASNEKGEAVSQVVNLVDIPEEEKNIKPEIWRKLADRNVIENKPFELLISLRQLDRKCKVYWYKGSSVVKETKDITSTFDGTVARLTFSSAKLEHASSYKVVCSNEAGKDESSCKITVEKSDEKNTETAEEQSMKESEETRKIGEENVALAATEEDNIKEMMEKQKLLYKQKLKKEDKAEDTNLIKEKNKIVSEFDGKTVKNKDAEANKNIILNTEKEDVEKKMEFNEVENFDKNETNEDKTKTETLKKSEDEKNNAYPSNNQIEVEKNKKFEETQKQADVVKNIIKREDKNLVKAENKTEEIRSSNKSKEDNAKRTTEEDTLLEDVAKIPKNMTPKRSLSKVEKQNDEHGQMDSIASKQVGCTQSNNTAELERSKMEIRSKSITRKQEIVSEDDKVPSRRTSLVIEEAKSDSLRPSEVERNTLEQPESKKLEQNKMQKDVKEGTPILKPIAKQVQKWHHETYAKYAAQPHVMQLNRT